MWEKRKREKKKATNIISMLLPFAFLWGLTIYIYMHILEHYSIIHIYQISTIRNYYCCCIYAKELAKANECQIMAIELR